MTEFVRPNGRVYRPRRRDLWVRAWENAEEFDSGCIVFGTLDPQGPASAKAHEACAAWYGDADSFHIAYLVPGWWRDGYGLSGRTWIEDAVRGAPGVMFTWAEALPPPEQDARSAAAGERSEG
jgi:hypothetical protein